MPVHVEQNHAAASTGPSPYIVTPGNNMIIEDASTEYPFCGYSGAGRSGTILFCEPRPHIVSVLRSVQGGSRPADGRVGAAAERGAARGPGDGVQLVPRLRVDDRALPLVQRPPGLEVHGHQFRPPPAVLLGTQPGVRSHLASRRGPPLPETLAERAKRVGARRFALTAYLVGKRRKTAREGGRKRDGGVTSPYYYRSTGEDCFLQVGRRRGLETHEDDRSARGGIHLVWPEVGQ